jgi:hypothetical protein
LFFKTKFYKICYVGCGSVVVVVVVARPILHGSCQAI